MGKLLYGRVWEVLVTQPNKGQTGDATKRATEETDPRSEHTLPQKSFTKVDVDVRTSTDGRGNTGGGGSSTAIVSLFNLTNTSVDFVSKQNNFVRIRAGYGKLEDAPTIFTGMVVMSNTRQNGPTKITTLHIKEANSVTDAVRASISVPPKKDGVNFSYQDVFKSIIDAWSLEGIESNSNSIYLQPSEIIGQPPHLQNLPGGFSSDGFLRDITDELCRQWGYTWYIERNILHIYPKKYKDLRVTQKYSLTLDLIKDIQPRQGQSSGISSRDSENGISLTTFLDGRITVGSLLEIPKLPGRGKIPGNKTIGEKELSGTYVVRKLNFELDSKGPKWDTVIEADKVEGGDGI